ncbi:hydroxyacid dehydrogenase [Virgibacillus kimchii]
MKILQILDMHHPDGEEILRSHVEVIKTMNYNPDHLKELVQDVDGIIVRGPARITAEILNVAHRVKVISGTGNGYDNIDVAAATEKGIPVLHAPKINHISTAEHAVGLIFALTKKVIPYDHHMKNGNFSIRSQVTPFELKQKKLGLAGFGHIAQEVARICSLGLQMEVYSYVRDIDEQKKVKAESLGVKLTTNLEDIFSECDIISLHIPLNDATEGLVNESLLSLMKPTSYIINTARGAIINEDDLYHSLKEKKIAGAGLDVYTEEPPAKEHPLFNLDNVVLTPHIGGLTLEAAKKSGEAVAINFIDALNGGEIRQIANPEVLSARF